MTCEACGCVYPESMKGQRACCFACAVRLQRMERQRSKALRAARLEQRARVVALLEKGRRAS